MAKNKVAPSLHLPIRGWHERRSVHPLDDGCNIAREAFWIDRVLLRTATLWLGVGLRATRCRERFLELRSSSRIYFGALLSCRKIVDDVNAGF